MSSYKLGEEGEVEGEVGGVEVEGGKGGGIREEELLRHVLQKFWCGVLG